MTMEPLTLDQIIEKLEAIRREVGGSVKPESYDSDGEWDWIASIEIEGTVRGPRVVFETTGQFVTG